MSPPSAKYRYNANKLDNVKIPRKPPKLLNGLVTSKKEKKRKSNSKAHTVDNFPALTTSNVAFKTLVSARLCSAIWVYISDCDETFNYWEPLHYIIYGSGLQTWEYSPQYALRSYTYLLMQGVPGWIYQKLLNPSPLLVFYMIRCILGFGCALMERYLYKSICQEFGIHIARLWLIFQLFSVGMFISSTALLPSSFTMYLSCASLAAWWNKSYSLAIFLTAISTFLGWPFSALIGVPIAYDMLIRKRLWKTFAQWSLISVATIALPMIAIDSTYFGKLTFAPLNIVWYNVFTRHGPNIFGTEPLSYYLINGFLNFNIIWILALIMPLLLVLDYYVIPAKSKSTLNYPHYLSLAPLYLWLIVFFAQKHKEERFLFPVYPLISLCGAISVDVFQRFCYFITTLVLKTKNIGHYLNNTMFIAITIMVISSLLGVSRVFSLHRNYHAPMDIMAELGQFTSTEQYREDEIYNVCIGKDWYRYPGSFFMPARNFRLRFLKSEFRGMLPAYYSEGLNATRVIQPYFNNMNKEDERVYFDYNQCDYLIDFDEGKYTELEPNYANRSHWTIVKSLPFLKKETSHQFFRAFYVPFLSKPYIDYGKYNLLKRTNARAK